MNRNIKKAPSPYQLKFDTSKANLECFIKRRSKSLTDKTEKTDKNDKADKNDKNDKH